MKKKNGKNILIVYEETITEKLRFLKMVKRELVWDVS